jgi:Protein of unknown function (DUF3347)
MKSLITLITVIAALAVSSCNNESKNPGATAISKKDTPPNAVVPVQESKNKGVNDLVSAYLQVKNALTEDNGREAATSAGEIPLAIFHLDASVLSPETKKMYDEVKGDIQEHAEHIGANGGNIEHQREHFELLSQDMIDLVKTSGSTQTLYREFCPMYNNNKGGTWLSEMKEIKNPYLGKKMPDCGEVKEEIRKS